MLPCPFSFFKESKYVLPASVAVRFLGFLLFRPHGRSRRGCLSSGVSGTGAGLPGGVLELSCFAAFLQAAVRCPCCERPALSFAAPALGGWRTLPKSVIEGAPARVFGKGRKGAERAGRPNGWLRQLLTFGRCLGCAAEAAAAGRCARCRFRASQRFFPCRSLSCDERGARKIFCRKQKRPVVRGLPGTFLR